MCLGVWKLSQMNRKQASSSAIEDIGLAIGTVLQERYELRSYVSMGQTSLIYLAWDLKNKKEVIVKEFCPYAFANRDLDHKTVVFKGDAYKKQYQQMRLAFEQECQVLKLLADRKHGNKEKGIVAYLDSFDENESVYLVTEYIAGRDLEEAVRSGEKLPYKRIIRQIIRMVIGIHKAGILHLDLKPSNILINEQQELVLIDFGSARFARESVTAASFTKGYSAPELFTNGAVSKRSDIYSVGAIIYYFTTGHVPENAKERLCEDDLEPVSSYASIPPILEYFILKCLRLEEMKRPKGLRLLYYLFL